MHLAIALTDKGTLACYTSYTYYTFLKPHTQIFLREYAMRLIGDFTSSKATPVLHHATPCYTSTMAKAELICIHWSADAQVGVIAGQWQRLTDGRIEATYAPDELTIVLCIAGYDVTEELIRRETVPTSFDLVQPGYLTLVNQSKRE